MGLASEMKNMSEEILASFKQRIKENEELVNEVQNTLDGFRKDHQEMAAVLNANAMKLRNDLNLEEKERLGAFNGLMSGIHSTIVSIQKEVVGIQTSTVNMMNELASERTEIATELKKTFAADSANRVQDKRTRMAEFNGLMKEINDDIKNIDNEVLAIFKNTNDMLDEFEKEHLEMSAELKAELSKNLTERVGYTRTLLHGFHERLSEISKENQKIAQKLRKDLNKGEAARLSDYDGIMKEIHTSINGIRSEVKNIQKATADFIGDYARDRSQGTAEWNKMQDSIAHLRKTDIDKPKKETAVKAEKIEEVKIEKPVETVEENKHDGSPKVEAKPEAPMTLEEKILAYINNHPMGVKISEMEAPLGETRMKLGFIAKTLLNEGKVQKMDNIYFPIK